MVAVAGEGPPEQRWEHEGGGFGSFLVRVAVLVVAAQWSSWTRDLVEREIGTTIVTRLLTCPIVSERLGAAPPNQSQCAVATSQAPAPNQGAA